MGTDDLLARIAIDPNVSFGKPTIRGTRIWVGLILGFLADGVSVEDATAGIACDGERAVAHRSAPE